MLTNCEKLQEMGILELAIIKLNISGQYENVINSLDSSKITESWIAWKLGDKRWWTYLKQFYNDLQNIK
jgi:hypothetical protein